ncbi:hypothetical protein TCAL_16734 [Tigriopus californicus]|uniref:Uncharacterized protein n=1 Tax=Tigriopus californicus TaxID=6832 RepID=A0A553PTR4_TIGCA|nr:uncharacterized protein LOC131891639 [Tigriopus californicus]XP_059097251.1 uncharacterized protein LOC131891639 [Tigriopus californicus]TRY81073.1 hypothetical protein TCAL_16734 [Tigriopus californicus]
MADVDPKDASVASIKKKFASQEEWATVTNIMRRVASNSAEAFPSSPTEDSIWSPNTRQSPARLGQSRATFMLAEIHLIHTFPHHVLSGKVRKPQKKLRKNCQVHERTSSSDDSGSPAEDDLRSSARAKDENWPHPLAKLIGQEGTAKNYAALSGDE